MKRIIVVIFVILSLYGCGSSNIKEDKKPSILSEYGTLDIITNADTYPLTSKFKRYDLKPDDPRVKFDDYEANYKLFEVDLDGNETLNIEIQTICSCFGINKKILVPRAYIVNESGELVEGKILNPKVELSFISLTLLTEELQPGKYYVVLAANNSKPGEPVVIDTAKVNGYISTGIRVSNKSSPRGLFLIKRKVDK